MKGLNGGFEDDGILVDVKKGREIYQLPLADLEVTDYYASQYEVVKDYAVWFANRQIMGVNLLTPGKR